MVYAYGWVKWKNESSSVNIWGPKIFKTVSHGENKVNLMLIYREMVKYVHKVRLLRSMSYCVQLSWWVQG